MILDKIRNSDNGFIAGDAVNGIWICDYLHGIEVTKYVNGYSTVSMYILKYRIMRLSHDKEAEGYGLYYYYYPANVPSKPGKKDRWINLEGMDIDIHMGQH